MSSDMVTFHIPGLPAPVPLGSIIKIYTEIDQLDCHVVTSLLIFPRLPSPSPLMSVHIILPLFIYNLPCLIYFQFNPNLISLDILHHILPLFPNCSYSTFAALFLVQRSRRVPSQRALYSIIRLTDTINISTFGTSLWHMWVHQTIPPHALICSLKMLFATLSLISNME